MSISRVKGLNYWQLFFMFCWPYISIQLCNKTQLDALFILSSFHQSNATYFGHICSPSSGGILYIYNNWYVLCFLVDYLLAGLGRNRKYQLLYIYSIPPDDWLQICPKNVEADWRNKLRVNSASSSVLLYRYWQLVMCRF